MKLYAPFIIDFLDHVEFRLGMIETYSNQYTLELQSEQIRRLRDELENKKKYFEKFNTDEKSEGESL